MEAASYFEQTPHWINVGFVFILPVFLVFLCVFSAVSEQQIIALLLFFVERWPSKDKNKTVGVARQQRHFLFSEKENEAKENLALR